MNRIYFIAIFIACFLTLSFSHSQDLDWIEPAATGTGNATVAITAGSISLNGEIITTPGALVGVFYENNSGQLTCAGYVELDENYMAGSNVAIAVWGEDSGEDNGIGAGETMIFYLHLNGTDYLSISIDLVDPMTSQSVDNEFIANGLFGVIEGDFGETPIELDPCTCLDDTPGNIFGEYCILPNTYEYCTDPSADNYCNTEGFVVIGGAIENCIYGAVEGCTCPSADNYNVDANSDDGTCYMLEGCSNPLASNYSLSGCTNVDVVTENCLVPGCTCPEAVNYDVSATENDGSCVSLVSICTDPTAPNFNEGCENTTLVSAVENCEAGSCELENIIWDFDITDANMTIQIGADVVMINGEAPPVGSLIGAFFVNDLGGSQCGGYLEWTGDQLALAVWAAESGYDNGFQAGEEITWLLYVGNQTFSANSITINNTGPFSDTFTSNGFGQLLSANYECEIIGVFGCTESTAYNYNPDATIDDGSCYNLDWAVGVTDCNMTILIDGSDISAGDISLNGDAIPNGAIIGVFYENQQGQLVCGGLSEPWENTSTAVPAWGAESGLDNGFQTGEEITTWFLSIGDQTIPMDENGAVMSTDVPFQNTYSCNGFGQLLSINFEGEYVLTYGCTDTEACNYDSSAILDDETCEYGQTWYQDSDGDGLGNLNIFTDSCEEISGFVTNGDDPCPDNINNPNNTIIWYYDEDGDGLGDDVFTVDGCSPPGPDFADNPDDPCPYTVLNDSDGDGICDDVDDCIGQYDALGVCNGDCIADTDSDGVCDDDEVVGCADAEACNYSADATDNDNSCLYLDGICETCENGDIIDNDIDNDGVCDELEIDGCTDDTMLNYDSTATDDNGSCIPFIYGCTDSSAYNYNEDANTDDGSCIPFIYGCTDPQMWNYDADANTDDDSCIPFIFGCMDDAACNYNPDANTGNICTYAATYYNCDGVCLVDIDGDGVCDELEIDGCTDDTMLNYDSTATDDDGSCIAVVLGCIDNTAFNYDANANTDNGTCCYVDGCNDPTAFNYNESACYNDGSCIAVVLGCIDDTALNYNVDANTDDGSCYYNPGCTDVTALNYNVNADYDDASCCYIGGCTDSTMFNYDDTPCYDDGSCVPFIFGCMDQSACNYDNTANTEDGNCTYAAEGETCAGCTNPEACNYSEGSINDDGSCIFLDGCTDDTACNYSPDAECDDNSCWYATTWYLDDDGDGLGFDSGLIGFPFNFESCEDFSDGFADNANDPNEGDFDNDFVFTVNDCDDTNPEIGATDGVCETCENGEIVDNDSDDDGVCDGDEIPGCQDSTACNYNPEATNNDDSCFYLDGICETCENGDIIDNDIDNDGVCDNDEIAGCQDIEACNYNSDVTDSDNSCLYLDGICETCENGDIIDNDIDNDGVCDGNEIPGCTDASACNYDSSATDDDGLCYNNDLGCGCDTPAANAGYDCDGNCLIDSDGDGVCDGNEIPGCTDTSACNYDSSATDDDGLCYNNDLGCGCDTPAADAGYDCDGNCLTDSDGDGVCDEFEIAGCQDSIACNYNPDATDNDNSCFYLDGICETCENGDIIDNDIDNDGVCNGDEIPGCIDPNACNFDPDLGCTDDDGSCFYSEITVEYSTELTSCVAYCDGSIELIIENGQPPYVVQYTFAENGLEVITGGNLPNACYGVYNILVSDAYNCESELEIFIDTNGNDIDSDGDGICDDDEIVGCMDALACNYNSEATNDDLDAPCEYCTSNLGDIDGDGINDCQLINDQAEENGNAPIYDCGGCVNDMDLDGVCDELETIGCTDDEACNYSVNYSDTCDDDDGDGLPDCCAYVIIYYLDCDGNCITDDDDDGVCNEIEILGCQDPEACNFNPDATDSGECDYPEIYDCDGNCVNDENENNICDELEIEGCTDGTACNFNPDANVDDGECYYLEDLSSTISTVGDASCANSADGQFTISVNGGSAPYTLLIASFGNYEDEFENEYTVTDLPGGSYDIVITDSNGCSLLETVSIEEIDPITATIEYLNGLDCNNENAALTASVQGGLPPYAFEWEDEDGNTYNTQNIDGLSDGEYTLLVTDANTEFDDDNNPIACFEAPYEITIDPLPELLIDEESGDGDGDGFDGYSISHVTCDSENNNGSVEVFVIGGTTPYTYVYTTNDNDPVIVNPGQLSAGSYIVTITDSGDCEQVGEFEIFADFEELIVEIDAAPGLEICEDEIVVITATNGFEDYQWFHDGLVLSDNDAVIEVSEAGGYWVIAVDEDGCEGTSSVLSMIVYENPIFNINGATQTITGNTYNYYVSENGNDYEWSIEDSSLGTINGDNDGNSAEITWNLQGSTNLYLTQTNENGCSTTESMLINITWPVSLVEFTEEEMDFIIYPNPFIDYTTIEINNPQKVTYDLYVYDIKGVIVKTFMNQTENKIILEKEFSNGIYHVQLISSKGNRRKLIIVE